MIPKLQRLFDQLESDRIHLQDQLRLLSYNQFHQPPAIGWSIQQIVAHLIAAERLSVDYINKKNRGIATTENTGLYEEFKMLALRLSQRLPLKFKAPKVVVQNTTPYDQLDQLIAAWDATRLDLKTLLDGFQEKEIRKKIYNHVRAGKLNIQHALIFFREHYFHHLPQINRLLKNG